MDEKPKPPLVDLPDDIAFAAFVSILALVIGVTLAVIWVYVT